MPGPWSDREEAPPEFSASTYGEWSTGHGQREQDPEHPYRGSDGTYYRSPQQEADVLREDRARKESPEAYERAIAERQERDQPDLAWSNLTPEDMVAAQESGDYSLGEAAGASVQADPEAIAAERAALAQLQEMASQGGYTAADRARIRQGQRAAGAYAASQRGAIENQARARGMGGSGMELASLLAASQGGANMSAASTDAATRAAEERAFDAIQMSGQLGSQMRGESFGEGESRAGARDARDMWNMEFERQRAQRNADREQATRGMNTQTRNQFMQGNAEAQRRYKQQMWGNQTAIDDTKMGMSAEERARREQQRRDDDASSSNLWSGILGAAGTVGGALVAGPAGAAVGGAAGSAAGKKWG